MRIIKLLFLLVFTLCLNNVKSQESTLEITGVIDDLNDGIPLKNVTVYLVQNSVVIQNTKTDFEGKYKFNSIAANGIIRVKFEKIGYVGKFAEIDMTTVTNEVKGVFPLIISTSLFRNIKVIDFSILTREPMAKAYYNEKIDNIEWDLKYIEKMKSKIEKIIEDGPVALLRYYEKFSNEQKKIIAVLKLKEKQLNKNISEKLNHIEKQEKELQLQLDSLNNLNARIEQKNRRIEEGLLTIGSQKFVIFLFASGVVILLILSILVLRGYQQKKKSNKLILIQKQEVELQKEIVEEKNHEILDSINYAKRIQTAILPPHKIVKKYLPHSFILYKPKDIVAGDFYWMEHTNNKILIAACDCTGHGVPGAMVSVVCNNGLNRSVREYGLTEPGKILDKTREIVIQEFEKSEEEVKDGMDVSLCSLDLDNLKLTWAGANNPLWLIRNSELLEYKPNKQPIGKYSEPKPFTTLDIELQNGDAIYIFTDGFSDQFGGEKGKKFKSAKFKELLLSIQDNSMEEQKGIIDETFKNWTGNLEQNDDVCVIGVKI